MLGPMLYIGKRVRAGKDRDHEGFQSLILAWQETKLAEFAEMIENLLNSWLYYLKNVD